MSSLASLLDSEDLFSLSWVVEPVESAGAVLSAFKDIGVTASNVFGVSSDGTVVEKRETRDREGCAVGREFIRGTGDFASLAKAEICGERLGLEISDSLGEESRDSRLSPKVFALFKEVFEMLDKQVT